MGAGRVGVKIHQAEFQQWFGPQQQGEGQFLVAISPDEIFHVDLQKQETIWHPPEYGALATSFEAQGALQSSILGKSWMDFPEQQPNISQSPLVPPKVKVLPKHRVELGDPKILTCYVDKFWPPLVFISWLRKGQEVTDE
ncbi:LOW QUALITY PROTEIN: mamu class II histocompatibility antigen, DR alpha chain-like [Indicator indicator]|uniref:LOW QUALITY PROTEIN: mamu class II histocompatibility antigen, DR alpha chain-like n=1 Tax=Indicator indicator TaxID=1002788 RepID=UPI0023DF101F|nr:LOW QUALITY PROTEIN: mamu class II histocompatibility antigen, DR alpha chain-like [Indicator indicator]